jgi:signal transduction histidine kinase
MEECLQLSADLLEDIRALVGNLREHDPIDLQHALTELTRPFSQPEFTIEVAPGLALNDLAVAENLVAVAREAITNVVRHAGASHCTIAVSESQGQVHLDVTDDGSGTRGQPEGFGIRGMRERVEGADGRLEIGPNPPRGTRLSAVWESA